MQHLIRMLPRRLRSWLALATLVALASCELNPQPVLPGTRDAAAPNLGGGKGTGGSGLVVGTPDDSGATPGDAGAPSEVDSGGAGSLDPAAGGASDGSASGGQNVGGEAGAQASAGGAGGSDETP